RGLLRLAAAGPIIASAGAAAARAQQVGQDPARGGPDPIPTVPPGPAPKTVPRRPAAAGPTGHPADASAPPRDPAGSWSVDFAFKPVRLVSIEMPDKRRRPVHYLYYRVINRTGKDRMFVPQFTLVTDTGKRYEDTVLRQAVKLIQDREDPTAAVPLYGAVDV